MEFSSEALSVNGEGLPTSPDRTEVGQNHARVEQNHMKSGQDAVNVAYVVSRYPALSHAFIEREVEALRDRGARIETVSVRQFERADLRTEAMRSEAAATTVLLGGPKSKGLWARSHAQLLRRSPAAYLKVLGGALRTGERTPRARLWQVFYFGEAVVLHNLMAARDLHHVHAHFANNGADIARLAKRIGETFDGPAAGWKWSFTMHGPTEFEAVDRFDLPAKVRSADGVACISDFCRSQLMRMVEPDQWEKLRMIRMSVDVDKFVPPASGRGAHDGPMRVLYVGRLVPEKGSPVLLDAIADLHRRGVDLDVRLVGSGPLQADLEKKIAEAGLQDVVTMMGPIGQDDLPEQYHWADAFVLPSFQEGLPVVLMEAMSTELPVITTRIAGISELVDDPTMGRVLPAGRVDQLAEAIAGLAQASPEQRQAMGRAGREAVIREFTSDRSVDGLISLFDTIENDPATGSSPRPA